MPSMYPYQQTIRNERLGTYKTIKAQSLFELQEKVAAQEHKWAEEDERARVRQEIGEERAQAEQDSDQARLQIEQYSGLPDSTLSVDDVLEWESLKSKKPLGRFSFKEEPPSNEFSESPPLLADISKRLRVPAPSFLEKVLAPVRQKRIDLEQQAQATYEQELSAYEARRQKAADESARLLKEYEQRKAAARAKYDRAKADYEEQQVADNASIDQLKVDFESGAPEAIERYVRIVLERSAYPQAITKDFDVLVDANSGTVEIDYWLPNPTEVPCVTGYKYVTTKRESQPVMMKKREFDQFYESIVCQVTLRTLHEVFESEYTGRAKTVVFNGWVEGIDTKTGHDFSSCIISCSSTREQFESLNLARVSPRDCIRNLKGLTAGPLANLAPVKPIVQLNREDSRFVEARAVLDSMDSSENLATMDWEDFEHLVRELFEKVFSRAGGEVRITRASRDWGVDAIAFDPDPIRGGKFVIQAKRYNNLVPVSAARDLYGSLINEGATKGILVTTSWFGPETYEFAKDKPITLIDGSNLVHMFSEHGYDVRIELQRGQV